MNGAGFVAGAVFLCFFVRYGKILCAFLVQIA